MGATDSSENVKHMKQTFLQALGDASFRVQITNKMMNDSAVRSLMVNKMRMEIKAMVPVIH